MREPIGASLTRISPVSDSSSRYFSPDTREYPVELTLDWTPPSLKPGIGVQVEILVDSIADAISVPLTAIYSAGADTFVFTPAGPDGQTGPRKVNIGVANETHVRVTDGLQAGRAGGAAAGRPGPRPAGEGRHHARADDEPQARRARARGPRAGRPRRRGRRRSGPPSRRRATRRRDRAA
jgi:hypothetical protein